MKLIGMSLLGMMASIGIMRGHAATVNQGPVMSANENVIMKQATVYPIYYGKWDKERVKKMQKFLSDLDASEWFRTDKINYGLRSLTLGKRVVIESNTTRLNQYDFGAKFAATNGWFTGLSYDPKTSQNQVLGVIHGALAAGQLPTDPNGIYLFMPSESVKMYSAPNEFTWGLGKLCAFHDYFTTANKNAALKYAVVPDFPSCSENKKRGMKALPGSDYGLDSLFLYVYHELVETMTDPVGTGYYVNDKKGDYYRQENADLCNFDFGTVCVESGAYYNTEIDGVKYLLQTNYDPKARVCKSFGNIAKDPAKTACKSITVKF